MLMFPKNGPKPKKPRKPIGRRTPLKKCRGAFKAVDNGKRTRRRTDGDVMAWALQKQHEKLGSLSPYQIAIGEFLRDNGIRFEFEKIWPNGDAPIFSDIFLPDHHLTIEVDDRSHDHQGRHDKKRAMYIARNFSVGTIRFKDAEVRDGCAWGRLKQTLGLSD
jgi:hypothetical protein